MPTDGRLLLENASGLIALEDGSGGLASEDYVQRGTVSLTASSTLTSRPTMTFAGPVVATTDTVVTATHSLESLGLLPGKRYRVRARPTDTSNNVGSWSSWVEFDTPLTTSHPFATASWLWDPIPASPVIDTNSASYISDLNDVVTYPTNTAKVLGIYEYAVPVYEIQPTEPCPTYSVPCSSTNALNPRTVTGVPIPYMASPSPNSPASDGAMVVIDWRNRKLWEFYDLYWNYSTANWAADEMSVYDFDTAAGRNDARDGVNAPANKYGMVGAGFSRFAGLITRADLTAAWPDGFIPHALVYSSSMAAGTFRYPAAKTDGVNAIGAANPIPEGSRLWLPRTYDVDGSGMSTLGKILARTLQMFGAYCIDNGGARVAFVMQGNEPAFAHPPTDPGDPTVVGGWGRTYGINSDYQGISELPWSSMQILRQWDGG